MITKWWGCAAAAVEGQLCVVGEYDKNDNIISSEKIYDPQTRKWKDIPSMTNKWWNFVSAAIEGQLCVIGGYEKNDKLVSSMESTILETGLSPFYIKLAENGDSELQLQDIRPFCHLRGCS